MSRLSKRLKIYLDNASATPISQIVKKEVIKATELYGNPSSFNNAGRAARKKFNGSRLAIARFLGSKPEEIIFTSSGSEANNLALFGLAEAYPDRKEIITSPIEHPSVLKPLQVLSKRGYKIIFVRVNSVGLVDVEDLRRKITLKTLLVSIMYANNEIGTIQPIIKASRVIKEFRKNKLEIGNWKLEIDEKMFPFFHVDACQATEYLDMNVNNLGVDLLTFNGSKIYGPRGIAVLYKKRGVLLKPIIYGGDQEYSLRAGTENLPAVAGLAVAIGLIDKRDGQKLLKLREYFFDKINIVIRDVKINGSGGLDRLPNNINISIPELNDENLLLELDRYGIQASSGSACTARSVEPSHVLKAIDVSPRYLNGALRFSMGRQTTKKDIDYLLEVLLKIVKDLKKRYGK